MSSEDAGKMIALLVAAEEGAAALYRACAKVFPDEVKLWNRLLREELQHAEYVRRAGEAIGSNPERSHAARDFNARAVREFIRGARDARRAVESGSMGKLRALRVAYEMEESYVEKDFAGALFCNDPALARLYRDIVTESSGHRNLLRDALDDELRRKKKPQDRTERR